MSSKAGADKRKKAQAQQEEIDKKASKKKGGKKDKDEKPAGKVCLFHRVVRCVALHFPYFCDSKPCERAIFPVALKPARRNM